jgi:hypothetical protein
MPSVGQLRVRRQKLPTLWQLLAHGLAYIQSERQRKRQIALYFGSLQEVLMNARSASLSTLAFYERANGRFGTSMGAPIEALIGAR